MRELVESVREGKLGRRVSRLLNQRERQAEARIQALREQLEDAEEEVDRLRLYIRTMDRDIRREREN